MRTASISSLHQSRMLNTLGESLVRAIHFFGGSVKIEFIDNQKAVVLKNTTEKWCSTSGFCHGLAVHEGSELNPRWNGWWNTLRRTSSFDTSRLDSFTYINQFDVTSASSVRHLKSASHRKRNICSR